MKVVSKSKAQVFFQICRRDSASKPQQQITLTYCDQSWSKNASESAVWYENTVTHCKTDALEGQILM